jgi:hypothetical protein
VRAGTILTISEDDMAAEIRDRYPDFIDPPSAPITHDTGHRYGLGDDPRFDPIGVGTPASPQEDGDWHVHFRVDEAVTQNQNMDTQYFLAGSNIKADNDDWRHFIFDATNPGPGPAGDLVTGLVQGPIGENEFDWGQFTGGGGVNNQELIALIADPADGLGAGWYEDVDFSTFGRPNMYNVGGNEATLGGAQDFSALRAWLASVKIGDANYDDQVDQADFEILMSNMTGPGATDTPWSLGSFDGDGAADMQDVSLLQLNFGA